MSDALFSVGAVILAAGRATRMGRPKLLLPWGATSILGHLIECWRGLGAAQIVVVCAGGDPNILAEVDRLAFGRGDLVENPDPQRGMFSSIRCAAQWPGWRSAITHWAMVLGDQPHLQVATLRKLIHWTSVHPGMVCQPSLQGRGKHPVILPKTAFFELGRSAAKDLKEFLSNYSIAPCACEDPGLALDIDWPEDYEQALRLAGLEAGNL